MEKIDFKKEYEQWCKDTKRSGGVLVGSSIQELLLYFQIMQDIRIKQSKTL